MKLTLLIVLVFSICLARGAPFSKDTLAFYVSNGGNCFIYEYNIAGSKIQEIPLSVGLSCSGGTPTFLRLDETRALLTVPLMTNNDNKLVTYDPNGDVQYTTTIPVASVTAAYAGLVSAQSDFWVVSLSAIGYTTGGSSGAPINANILPPPPSGPGYAIGTAQLIGTVLYYSNSFSGTMYQMDPVQKTTAAASAVDFLTGARVFYIHNNAVYVHSGSTLKKFAIENGVATFQYSADINLSPDALTAIDFDGTTYLLYQILSSATQTIVRYTDTGSDFIGETTIVTTNTFKIKSVSPSPVASCTDNIKDQDETDTDCGGATCSGCALDKSCLLDRDCSSGYCNVVENVNVCATPTCEDSVKNQDETDVDCGGATCSNKCADGKGCDVAGDCSSGVCNTDTGSCAAPTCNDGVPNQDESDTDCGGAKCSKCADGATCNSAGDCSSGVCNMDTGTCSAPSCADSVMNGAETDVDCGGNSCSGCAINKKCSLNSDCAGNECVANLCAASCQDNILNQDETDIDCGGSTCSKCAFGKKCDMDSDCETNTCASNACANPPVAPPQPIDTPVNGPQSVESPVSSSPTGSQAPASSSPVSSTPIKQKPVSASSVTEMSVLGLLSLLIIFA